MKTLSLFSCSGISEFYLSEVGVEVVVSNELLEDRADLYKYFYPSCTTICGDVIQCYDDILRISRERGVECILATPPCQSFSVAGRREDGDPRTPLFQWVIRFVLDLDVKYCLIENVPTFLNSKIDDVCIIDNIINLLGDGYIVRYGVLNAKDFGTPQSRKRAIILISRVDCAIWELPQSNGIPVKTVMESIGHLPSLESGDKSEYHPFHSSNVHNENHILWMKHTPSGHSAFDNEVHYPVKDGRRIKGFKTTYKRIGWDTPCPTITMANGSVSSQNNVHPGRQLRDGTYSDARCLSIYEIILLSGLDDKWADLMYEYTLNESISLNKIRGIIGEAFPPKFCLSMFNGLVEILR